MRFKLILNLIGLICLVSGITTNCASYVFSQDTSQEKQKIKDFGKSLREKKEKNESKSKNESKEKNESKNKVASPNTETVSENESEDEEVLRVETSLVRTDVLVVDKIGRTVLGLKSNDFVITENNVQQEIGTFSTGSSEEVPRSIVLIIDYSGSQIPYIQTSVNAAKVLVNKLNPNDKMAIVTDDVELLADFTKDKDLLKNKLDSLAVRVTKSEVGKSLQYSALMATLNELFDNEDVRPIIIFQTDGDQFFDIKPANAKPNQPHSPAETTFTDKELIETVEKSHATIYSVISGDSFIGLSPEERFQKTEKILVQKNSSNYQYGSKKVWAEFVNSYYQKYSEPFFKAQTSMVMVARASGGFSENLETPDQADEIYSRILNGINYRYLIGYYATSQESNGTRRNVKIEVRGHPEYVVWGRKFYFAPQEK